MSLGTAQADEKGVGIYGIGSKREIKKSGWMDFVLRICGVLNIPLKPGFF